jgi:hypothetical protein
MRSEDTGQRQFMMASLSIIFCFHPDKSKSPTVSVGYRMEFCNFFRLSRLRKVGYNILPTKLHVPLWGVAAPLRGARLIPRDYRTSVRNMSASPEYLNLMVHVTLTMYPWCWWMPSWRLFPVAARASSQVTMEVAHFADRLRNVLEVLHCPAVSKTFAGKWEVYDI